MQDSLYPRVYRAATILSFASAVSILFSIAVSQIFLALACLALLLSGAKLRLPPIWLPLGIFIAGTLLSLAFSPHPAAGLPQVRKLFVFLILLVVYSTLDSLLTIRRLFLCWAAAGALVAARGLVQFVTKLNEAHSLGMSFGQYYVSERITGFMSHWMTFGSQEMFTLLMLSAFLFFAPRTRPRGTWFWIFCAGMLLLALLLGFTRSIWLGSAAAGIYLLWFRKRVLVLLVPAALALGWIAGPQALRTRLASIFRPRGDLDSNQFRIVCWRTGWRMIRARPWLGLGPEEIKLQFNDYVAPDEPRPLPKGWYGHLHNIYIHYAAERGVPMMLVLVWMLAKILLDFLRSVMRLPPGPSDEKFILQGAIAVVIATLIVGIFELNLGDSEVLTMFLIVVASGYIAIRSVPKRESLVV